MERGFVDETRISGFIRILRRDRRDRRERNPFPSLRSRRSLREKYPSGLSAKSAESAFQRSFVATSFLAPIPARVGLERRPCSRPTHFPSRRDSDPAGRTSPRLTWGAGYSHRPWPCSPRTNARGRPSPWPRPPGAQVSISPGQRGHSSEEPRARRPARGYLEPHVAASPPRVPSRSSARRASGPERRVGCSARQMSAPVVLERHPQRECANRR